MDRQSSSPFRPGLVLTCGLIWIGSGCHQLEKRGQESAAATKTETSKADSPDAAFVDQLKVDSLSGAHSPGRSAASWSSEAREIESHFNVR